MGGREGVLIAAVGAKGAVGSTVCAAVAALKDGAEEVSGALTTAFALPGAGDPTDVVFSGWDIRDGSIIEAIKVHQVLPQGMWSGYEAAMQEMKIFKAPSGPMLERVERVVGDLEEMESLYPWATPVVVNLLPAARQPLWPHVETVDELLSRDDWSGLPDIPYLLGALRKGVPFVNFTSNPLEHPVLVEEARVRGVPLAGRDGKTGQTYLKVVLASALKARSLRVRGWYSLNILGNDDGRNLSDPAVGISKVENKTKVLDEILGYQLGGSHLVRIDYYEPRGDSKEAWDVIDFVGAFGLPMSLRLNLLARDSVLAAPMVVDLARWMAAMKGMGRSGVISELAFYFKRPLGLDYPKTFQEQISALEGLRRECQMRLKKQ